MPDSTRSAASSGGVRSSTFLIAPTTLRTGSSSASRTSAEVMIARRGRPVSESRPRISTSISSSIGSTEPAAIFSRSAVISPTSRLYLARMYWAIASLKSSPATRRHSASTTLASEITATSEVPPPMSTIMQPCGSCTGSSAPIAAAVGSSTRNTRRAPARSAEPITARFSTMVMPHGTAMTTCGLTMRLPPTALPMK